MIPFQGADADLGAGQVLEDRNGAVELTFESPDHADNASMERIVAVAEVEARDVHAGLDKLFENLFRSAGGTDGADDFCSSHFH